MDVALGRPATGLPRYYMDCGWYRHPNFAGLPVESLFLMEAVVGYSTEHATDGRAPADPEDLAAALGVRVSITRKGLQPLLDRGRLERIGSEIRVPGWEDHNPTAAEVEAHTAERSRSGVKGNHLRWHVQKGVVKPDCPWCVDPDPTPPPSPSDRSSESLSDRSSDPKAIAIGSHGMGWDGITTPQPPAQRGAMSDEHDGSHRNCRRCGTSPRGQRQPPEPPPRPIGFPTFAPEDIADFGPPPVPKVPDEAKAVAQAALAEVHAALRRPKESA